MTLLNEVVVLTTPRLSEDILRPTHYETNLKQGAHTAWPVPVIGSCQYLTHAHSHITRAVAVMDSCFALIGAHQHGIAVIVLSLSRIKISKIQVNQQWRQSACSLRGRRLKGNGKEIPGAREARKACKGKEKESSPPPLSLARGLATKFPSFSNACHAGQRELRKEFYKNHNES